MSEEKNIETVGFGAVEGLLQMDVSKLTREQRVQYLWHFAQRQGLDPLLRPFDFIPDNRGSLKLYANKGCAEQLRKKHGISLQILSEGCLVIGEKTIPDVYVVKVRAALPDGRFDDEVGTISLSGLIGKDLAEAPMKATTKAKRRATLSICGLGMLDESEVQGMPNVLYDTEGPRRLEPGTIPIAALPAPETEREFGGQLKPSNIQTFKVPTTSKKYPPAAPPIDIE